MNRFEEYAADACHALHSLAPTSDECSFCGLAASVQPPAEGKKAYRVRLPLLHISHQKRHDSACRVVGRLGDELHGCGISRLAGGFGEVQCRLIIGQRESQEPVA